MNFDRSANAVQNAEAQFREAFLRLASGTPKILAPGALVTQNNVAREAGRDPSALRKTRYPELIKEIQAHVEAIAGKGDVGNMHDEMHRADSLRDEVVNLKRERDNLMSMLLEADWKILHLTLELEKRS